MTLIYLAPVLWFTGQFWSGRAQLTSIGLAYASVITWLVGWQLDDPGWYPTCLAIFRMLAGESGDCSNVSHLQQASWGFFT